MIWRNAAGTCSPCPRTSRTTCNGPSSLMRYQAPRRSRMFKFACRRAHCIPGMAMTSVSRAKCTGDRRPRGAHAKHGSWIVPCDYDTWPHTVRRVLRSEEHTSELQSRLHLVCRLLLEKKKKNADAV